MEVVVLEKDLKMGVVIRKWLSGNIKTIRKNGGEVDNKMDGGGYDFYISAFTGNG